MITNELKQRIKEQIGHYNAFRRGLFDVLDEADENAPPGWRVTYIGWYNDGVPPDGICVGQVRVHHGDPAFTLYAIPHWLDVTAACEFYEISKPTLTLALRQGKIARAKKARGKWRFPLVSLLEWDSQRQRGPGQPRKE